MGPYAEVDYITSPYIHSKDDSNTFTMGNTMPESTLSSRGTLDLASGVIVRRFEGAGPEEGAFLAHSRLFLSQNETTMEGGIFRIFTASTAPAHSQTIPSCIIDDSVHRSHSIPPKKF
jgi:hypothetical protein